MINFRPTRSTSIVAALAVKASVALQNASSKGGHRHNKARISPVLVVNQSTSFQSNKVNHIYQGMDDGYAPKWPKKSPGVNGKPGGGCCSRWIIFKKGGGSPG
jgi:hypothetical protein